MLFARLYVCLLNSLVPSPAMLPTARNKLDLLEARMQKHMPHIDQNTENFALHAHGTVERHPPDDHRQDQGGSLVVAPAMLKKMERMEAEIHAQKQTIEALRRIVQTSDSVTTGHLHGDGTCFLHGAAMRVTVLKILSQFNLTCRRLYISTPLETPFTGLERTKGCTPNRKISTRMQQMSTPGNHCIPITPRMNIRRRAVPREITPRQATPTLWVTHTVLLLCCIVDSHAAPSPYDVTPRLRHLYIKRLKAESHRKALVYQKRYLLLRLGGMCESEGTTTARLALRSEDDHSNTPLSPRSRFRAAVTAVVAVRRLKILTRRWTNVDKKAYYGTRK